MEYEEYKNEKGEFHRVDGPAVINAHNQIWFVNGRRHRIDGPSYISNYYMDWWINGKLIHPYYYIHEEIKDCVYGI